MLTVAFNCVAFPPLYKPSLQSCLSVVGDHKRNQLGKLKIEVGMTK